MTKRLVFLAALLLAPADGARAQPGASAVIIPQLTAPQRRGVVATSQADTAAAADTRREREALVSAGAPIGEGRRTAEASPALSTRAQSRAVHAAPVGGHDQCDAPNAADTRLCRHRLEARVDDFRKPDAAPITAEGRLLVLTDPQAAPMTVDQATRQFGAAPNLDRLAGGAASELVGAIATSRADAMAASSAAAGAGTGAGAATALPEGVPSIVLTPH